MACEEDLAVRVFSSWNQATQNINIGSRGGAATTGDQDDSFCVGVAVEDDECVGGGTIGPLSVIPEGRPERGTSGVLVSNGERTSVCSDVCEPSSRPPPAHAAVCSSPRQSRMATLSPFAAATGNLSLAATQAHQGTQGERAPQHRGDRSSAPLTSCAAERLGSTQGMSPASSSAAVVPPGEGVVALRLGKYKFVGSPGVLPIVNVTRVSLAGRRFPNESPRGKGLRVEAAEDDVAAVSPALPQLKVVDSYRRQQAKAEAQHAAVQLVRSRSRPFFLGPNPRSSCPPSEASPTLDNLYKA